MRITFRRFSNSRSRRGISAFLEKPMGFVLLCVYGTGRHSADGPLRYLRRTDRRYSGRKGRGFFGISRTRDGILKDGIRGFYVLWGDISPYASRQFHRVPLKRCTAAFGKYRARCEIPFVWRPSRCLKRVGLFNTLRKLLVFGPTQSPSTSLSGAWPYFHMRRGQTH